MKQRKRNLAQATPEFAVLLVFMFIALLASFTLLSGQLDQFFKDFSVALGAATGG